MYKTFQCDQGDSVHLSKKEGPLAIIDILKCCVMTFPLQHMTPHSVQKKYKVWNYTIDFNCCIFSNLLWQVFHKYNNFKNEVLIRIHSQSYQRHGWFKLKLKKERKLGCFMFYDKWFTTTHDDYLVCSSYRKPHISKDNFLPEHIRCN